MRCLYKNVGMIAKDIWWCYVKSQKPQVLFYTKTVVFV
jgi:hypothetical protein